MSNPIGWCTKTWNPITGCGPEFQCWERCWARRMANRLRGRFGYSKKDPFKVTVHVDRFNDPIKWRKPERIFVCSMGDFFHPDIKTLGGTSAIATMAGCPQHTFLLLTKRPGNAPTDSVYWLPNVWLGVSVENQDYDWRIRKVLEIPAAKRFVSIEPMLSKIDIASWGWRNTASYEPRINWVIVGCESGPKRRPCKLEWVRDIVSQCRDAEVPVYIKQLDIDGKVIHDIEQFPKDLQIREIPE